MLRDSDVWIGLLCGGELFFPAYGRDTWSLLFRCRNSIEVNNCITGSNKSQEVWNMAGLCCREVYKVRKISFAVEYDCEELYCSWQYCCSCCGTETYGGVTTYAHHTCVVSLLLSTQRGFAKSFVDKFQT